MTQEAQVLSVSTAARILGIGRNHAYELCRTGVIPSIRLGRRIVVPKVALEKMLSDADISESIQTG